MSDKVYVTYHAPEGNSKVCEMGGKTFFDGQAVELDSEADAALISQCEDNSHFEVSEHKKPEAKAGEHKDHGVALDPDGKPGSRHDPKPDHKR